MTPQEENIRLQQQVNQELMAYMDAQRAATKETEKAAEAEAKIEGATTAVIQIFEKLYSAQLKYNLAMAKGQKGASQFNDGIDAMTEATQIAAVALSLLVPGGALIKGVTAGLTFLATQAMKTAAEMQKAANEQADATYKAFQAFSKAGATGADGLKGFFNDVNRMRLNVHQLDAMATVIGNSGKEMASMGGTVYKARGQFANLVQGMGDYEQGMLNLGMSYDDQAEAAMGYMKLQSTLSQGQQQDYGKLAGGMKKYLAETEALTRVTGLNRKEQEAAQEKMLAQQRFGAKIQELRDEGTAESNKAADLLIAGMKRAAAQGDMAAQAYADQTTGMLTTDAAMKGNQSTQGKQLEQINDILEGRITTEDQLNASQQDLLETTKEFGKSMNKVFQTGVGEDFLLPFAEFQKTAKLANQNFAEQMADAAKEVSNLINSTAAVDNQLKSYTTLIKGQNDQMLALQASLNGTFTTVGVGLEGFGEIIKKTGEVMVDMTKKLLEAMGLYSPDAKKSLGAASDEARMYGGDPSDYASDQPVVPHPTDASGRKLSATEIAQQSSMSAEQNNAQLPKNKIDSLVADFRSAIGITGPKPAAAPAAGTPAAAPTTAPAGGKPPAAPAAAPAAAPTGGKPPAAAAPGSAPGSAPGGRPAGFPPAAPSGGPGPLTQTASNVTSYSDRLINYIRSTERFTPKAFWDKKQYTNGYGTKALSPEEVVSKDEAETRLQQYLHNAVSGVISYGKNKKYSWSQGQVDALTSFAYNGGIGMLDKLTQGGKRTNEQIAQSMMLYNKATDTKTGKTETLPGLTTRRAEELAMFQAANGGIFDGPKSGYAATLHGHEAVIPLKDGAVPVSMSQEFNMTATNLGELVAIMKNNIGMQASMLAVLEDIKRSQSSTADNTGKMVSMAA
jgi:GH24 family phage-related lysozyme (muramidase)